MSGESGLGEASCGEPRAVRPRAGGWGGLEGLARAALAGGRPDEGAEWGGGGRAVALGVGGVALGKVAGCDQKPKQAMMLGEQRSSAD